MKVVTRIDIAREVAERARDYPEGRTGWVARLRIVPPEQVTPEIVDDACGWNRTGLTCDECSALVESVVKFREDADEAQICHSCLCDALRRIRVRGVGL